MTRTAGWALRTVASIALRFLGLLIVAFAVARSAWYPFWAAGAPAEELARSWGGPGAVGATLTHWAVALGLGAVGWLMYRLGRRCRPRTR